ncbi:MAG: hypothetical protein KDD10_30105 [Phaeodactylibacter sp.]|nr:hypothetical protein [Phaeodactylibacter sp.]MCB9297514.1 hypothetical protein [Lewinellaceae bacterium]
MSLFGRAGTPGRQDKDLLERLLSRNRQQARAEEDLLFGKYQRLVRNGDSRLSKEEREQAYKSAFLDFIKCLPHQGSKWAETGGLGPAIERFFETAQKEVLWARAIRAGEEPAYTQATQELMLHLAPLKNSRQLTQKYGRMAVEEAFIPSFEELLKKISQEGFASKRSLSAFFFNIFKYRALDASNKEKRSALHNPASLDSETAETPAEYEKASVFNQFEEPSENPDLLLAERLRAFLDPDRPGLLEQLSREARMAVQHYRSDLLSDLASLIGALRKMEKEGNPCVELFVMKVKRDSYREIYAFLGSQGLLKETAADETSMKNLVNSRVRRCRDRLHEQLKPVFNLIYRKKKKR